VAAGQARGGRDYPCKTARRHKTQPSGKKLGSQYLSIVEVGGAYAHIFFDILKFLEIRTLVITDIDTVKPNAKGHQAACQVRHGQRTSNACIKAWFNKPDIAPIDLLGVTASAKIIGKRRLTYQQPETNDGPCGRSFEDAFMLANEKLFPFPGPSVEERETQAWDEAKGVKKSEFALQHALSTNDWNVPLYIRDGLVWLADDDVPTPPLAPTTVVVVA
jgi:hypothetical protein